MEISITLTDVEEKALAHAVSDPQDWAVSVIKAQARIAMDEIFQRELPRIMASGDVSILAGGVEAVVLAADLTPAEEESDTPPASEPEPEPSKIDETTEEGNS
jgi:hypothetical protein